MGCDMKYRMTTYRIVRDGRFYYRIEALRDFGNVKRGDLGGWIERESNLSHRGNAWVDGNARVGENGWVYENGWVGEYARVRGNARVGGDSRVEGHTCIEGCDQLSGDDYRCDESRND